MFALLYVHVGTVYVGCSSITNSVNGSTEPGPHSEHQLAGLSLLQQERQTRCQGPFQCLIIVVLLSYD